MLKALLIILFLGIPFQSANATVDVDCWFGDCLSEGWSVTDTRTRERGEARCFERNCRQNGWQYEARFGPIREFEAVCEPGGCFVGGWREKDLRTGRWTRDIVCEGRDCLTYGWRTYTYDGHRLTTHCLNDDCAKFGWYYFDTRGRVVETLCKLNRCFEEGWTVFPPR